MRECFKIPGSCWLCERYSNKILGLYEENNLSVLPLPCDLSETLYGEWDRGSTTKLYQEIEGMK